MRLGFNRSRTDRQDIDPPCSQWQLIGSTLISFETTSSSLFRHLLFKTASARAMRHSPPSSWLEGGLLQQLTNMELDTEVVGTFDLAGCLSEYTPMQYGSVGAQVISPSGGRVENFRDGNKNVVDNAVVPWR